MPPTSSRTFGPDRSMNVSTQGTPIYSDYTLPEINDLKKIKARKQAQQLSAPEPAQRMEGGNGFSKAEYDYEPIYGQIGQGYMQGGIFGWQPGQGFGVGTTPTAIGYKKTRIR